jgi:hypothetical protein
VSGEHVLGVLEPKILARELDPTSDVALSVAAGTGPFVVRLGVAPAAFAFGRKVQGARVACAGDAHMAFDAVDPLEGMRAMLEGVPR